MSAIDISYGKGSLPVRLPSQARPTIIRKPHLPKIGDPRAAIRQALDHPMGARPFKVLAQGRRSACILICDITRPVPNHLFLRPMIEDLLAAGVPADQICVLVATGLHRPNEGAGTCGADRRSVGPFPPCAWKITSRATTPTASTSAARLRAARRSRSTAASSRLT